MKTYFKTLTITGLLWMTQTALAQNKTAIDKIESAKIALITDRLDLSPEQAEKFWPLYNEYSNKKMELRQEYRRFRANSQGGQLSEEESKRALERGQKLKERQLQIERNYSERLLTVITNRQLLQLRAAEDDFRKMLLQRLEQRSSQMERREMMQQRMGRKANN
ncbi:hypothetical protein SAMN04488028_101374 [Reichenbachiella agariperforans]|uniref:LTXXQ motif family protein n=1 Tax=Reichenbachiella agariperforans TaxID=156994 RepID=A0A1M6JYQ3_REIAG|nr:hypothetical protein [Reichenbachiella agariperforans]SHJ51804.1 hypothetical protein SAMN04488028_101374 [Reichenbachiella agariperforans]